MREDNDATHQEKTMAIEKEIAELKVVNSTLTTEVGNLKKQVANKYTNTATSSTRTSSGGSSTPAKTTTSAPVASGGTEWF